MLVQIKDCEHRKEQYKNSLEKEQNHKISPEYETFWQENKPQSIAWRFGISTEIKQDVYQK